jgi:murein DD-endopeptidase MepM/ murein hydrolase activator NlpD
LAHASVTPERIDQGVDYSGSGPLDALGDGQITYVGTSGTGWPGAFIEFRLVDGPDAGRYVYYAEDVTPAQGLHVGQKVSAGQKLATIYQGGTGIEVGWGANRGTETYAAAHGGWTSSQDSNDVATSAGKSFSALLSSLGAPPGKVEG